MAPPSLFHQKKRTCFYSCASRHVGRWTCLYVGIGCASFLLTLLWCSRGHCLPSTTWSASPRNKEQESQWEQEWQEVLRRSAQEKDQACKHLISSQMLLRAFPHLRTSAVTQPNALYDDLLVALPEPSPALVQGIIVDMTQARSCLWLEKEVLRTRLFRVKSSFASFLIYLRLWASGWEESGVTRACVVAPWNEWSLLPSTWKRLLRNQCPTIQWILWTTDGPNTQDISTPLHFLNRSSGTSLSFVVPVGVWFSPLSLAWEQDMERWTPVQSQRGHNRKVISSSSSSRPDRCLVASCVVPTLIQSMERSVLPNTWTAMGDLLHAWHHTCGQTRDGPEREWDHDEEREGTSWDCLRHLIVERRAQEWTQTLSQLSSMSVFLWIREDRTHIHSESLSVAHWGHILQSIGFPLRWKEEKENHRVESASRVDGSTLLSSPFVFQTDYDAALVYGVLREMAVQNTKKTVHALTQNTLRLLWIRQYTCLQYLSLPQLFCFFSFWTPHLTPKDASSLFPICDPLMSTLPWEDTCVYPQTYTAKEKEQTEEFIDGKWTFRFVWTILTIGRFHGIGASRHPVPLLNLLSGPLLHDRTVLPTLRDAWEEQALFLLSNTSDPSCPLDMKESSWSIISLYVPLHLWQQVAARCS